MGTDGTERVETVIIGGGQAGLATGYFLQRGGRPAVILDAHERVGDAWRTRWDSLRLFTTARYDAVRFDGGDERSAVGSACRRIRQAVKSIQVRMAPEPSRSSATAPAERRPPTSTGCA